MKHQVWTIDFDRRKWTLSLFRTETREEAPGLDPEAVKDWQPDGSFIIKLANAEVRFAREGTGNVAELVLIQAGHETHAKRVE